MGRQRQAKRNREVALKMDEEAKQMDIDVNKKKIVSSDVKVKKGEPAEKTKVRKAAVKKRILKGNENVTPTNKKQGDIKKSKPTPAKKVKYEKAENHDEREEEGEMEVSSLYHMEDLYVPIVTRIPSLPARKVDEHVKRKTAKRPEKEQKTKTMYKDECVLYIKNLPAGITDGCGKIKEIFTKQNIEINAMHKRRRHGPIYIVELVKIADVSKALMLNGTVIEGNVLSIQRQSTLSEAKSQGRVCMVYEFGENISEQQLVEAAKCNIAVIVRAKVAFLVFGTTKEAKACAAKEKIYVSKEICLVKLANENSNMQTSD